MLRPPPGCFTRIFRFTRSSISREAVSCEHLASIAHFEDVKHGPFYQLSYSHAGRSTTRFVRPGYVPQIKRELAAYKRFRQLTEKWVTLALTLSQLRLEQARREEDQKN